jgi:hypothetical protein
MLEQRRRPSFTLPQIPPRDFDVAVFGKLPPTQLALDDHLEPGALEMKRLHAPLRCRALIEEPLEDTAGDLHGALVGTEDNAKFDAIPLVAPSAVFWELEKQHLLTSWGKEQNVPIMF